MHCLSLRSYPHNIDGDALFVVEINIEAYTHQWTDGRSVLIDFCYLWNDLLIVLTFQTCYQRPGETSGECARECDNSWKEIDLTKNCNDKHCWPEEFKNSKKTDYKKITFSRNLWVKARLLKLWIASQMG